MSQKWNLQDIKPANQSPRRSSTAKRTQRTAPRPTHEDPADRVPSITIEDGSKRRRSSIWLASVLFVAIIGGAALLSSMLGKTELVIYPEFRDPNISADFTAYAQPTPGALRYEIMTLEETAESQVTASGKIEKTEQATGIIEISKNTPGAERLIKNTRFRSPDGLVFRIQESVVVPGAVTNEAGESVPGTIQAEVFADEAGEEYNLAAGATFDVPGFEENGFTALFEAISANNPQPMTGGIDGPVFQIDDSELSTARQALQIQLRDSLLAKIESNKPAGTVAFPGAVAITYTQLPSAEYGTDLVTIVEQAVLQIPLFKADELGVFLAQESVATYSGGPVRVEDPSVIKFGYQSATTSTSVIANEDSLDFTLTGKPRLIWEYDAATLTENLAGLPKRAFENAIKDQPGIVAGTAHITPFWKQNFPENPEDIIIIEELREDI